MKLTSETLINMNMRNFYSLLLKVLILDNSYMPDVKLPSKLVTFYQSTKSQKVPLSVTSKKPQVTKEVFPKPQALMLPLLAIVKTEPKPDLDSHQVKEKLSVVFVDVPSVSLPEVVEPINPS